MTSPPVPFSQGRSALQSRRRWFNNWKIVVPIAVLAVALCLGLFVFALLSAVYSMIRASYPYKFALQRANESSEVASEVGNPFHVGWLMSGNLNYNNTEGDTNLSIPISGAKGHGRIIVVGKRRANRWSFETLEVDVAGQDMPIQLSNPPSAPAPVVPASPQ